MSKLHSKFQLEYASVVLQGVVFGQIVFSYIHEITDIPFVVNKNFEMKEFGVFYKRVKKLRNSISMKFISVSNTTFL